MAIVQISKIQQRSGDLVDLPQLDEAELGWATDAKRLFIGKTTPNENIEVLTSYSNIDFNQIQGSIGNLDISSSVANGQVLTYDGTNWVNRGGTVGGLINLGNVGNVKINGGAIGYVLETDGTGNLSWTPKGTIRANVVNLSRDTSNSFGILTNAVIMRVANTTPYTNGAAVTITGVEGTSNSSINSSTFYIKLASDFPTSGNTILFLTSDLVSANAFTLGSLTYTNSPNAIATTSLGGGGGSAAGGANSTVQFNSSNISTGSANFTYNSTTNLLTLSGNANVGNLISSGIASATRFISNVTTGTTPLQVTSTTRVANLNVAYANVSDFVNITTSTTGTQYLLLSSGLTGNVSETANANLTFNSATGNLGTTLLNVTSNANVGNLGTAGLIVATGNITGGNLNTAGALSVTGNANVGNIGAAAGVFTTVAGSLVTASQPNITSVGTLTSLAVTGNITSGNVYANSGTIGAANLTGTLTTNAQPNITSVGTLTSLGVSGAVTASTLVSNVATGTAPLTVTSTTQVANLNVATAGTAGTVTTAAQPNITSVGTLSSLAVTGNITSGNVYANSGTIGASLLTGTLTTAAQPNITSVGTLTSLTVTGNTTSGNVSVGSGAVTLGSLTTGANTTAGTITGNFTLTTGSRLNATYADLAEYYEADAQYDPGTVLEFGGEKEVTLAEDGTSRVAGVVSTNPAYAMNSQCPGYAVALALQGRVPVKVRGKIRKGDMMISGGNGYARPSNSPMLGSVIGKALENFDGTEGVIEIAIGRL